MRERKPFYKLTIDFALSSWGKPMKKNLIEHFLRFSIGLVGISIVYKEKERTIKSWCPEHRNEKGKSYFETNGFEGGVSS